MQHNQYRDRFFRLALTLLLACFGLAASTLHAPVSQAQAPNRASLIVVFSPDDVFGTCVGFSEPEISGIELLNRSGFTVLSQQVAGMGVTVCKIEETGCDFPGEACFCQCLGAPCNYWSYWTYQNGAWVYSGRGATRRMVQPGEIDAWVWGDGETEPPAPSSVGICTGMSAGATSTPPPPNSAQQYDPYPDDNPQSTAEPSATPEDAATPEPASGTTEEYPSGAATSAPTLEPDDEFTPTQPVPTPPREATATPARPGTDATAGTTVYPSESAARGESAATPDRSASIIARAATNAALTTVPGVTTEAAEKRSYWAFFGIALLLAALLGYVLLLRRQRSRVK